MAGASVIGALRVTLGLDSAAFSKGLKASQSRLAGFGKAVKTGMLAVGAAGVAAAGAIGVAVSSTIDKADEMAKASRSFGVPIEELSRLKYAADLSGVSFGNLGNSLRTLNKNAYDASNGTGAAKDAFEELGISVSGADGKLKSSTQLMGEVADALNGIDDTTKRAAISGKIFGERYGPQLASLLSLGSEGITKLSAEADTFGQVFTEQMGASAENFNDNMSRLKGTIGSIAAEITQKLLPYLEELSAWLVAHAPQIVEFAGRAIDAFASLVRGIGNVVSFLDQMDAAIVNAGETVRTGIRTLANDIVEAFKALPGQMAEIGRQIIAGLWQGIQAKWDSVKSGVSNLAGGLVSSVKSKLGIQSPSKVMREVGVNIMQGLALGMESMTSEVQGIMGDTSSGIQGAFNSIGQAIGGLISGTKSWRDVLSGVLSQLTQALFSSQALGSVFGTGGFGGLISGIFGGLFGFAQGGSFQVGGAGGIDSQLVAFRASPNETVSVTKPGQMAAGAHGMGVHVTVGWDVGANGNIAPIIKSVSDQSVREGAPAIVSASVSQVNKNSAGLITNAQRRSL